MSRPLLVLRPQPGAARTAAAAAALGLDVRIAPLFTIKPLGWSPPDPGGFDAVMLTSANAARFGGAGLETYLALPCYAVGEATADAATERGFGDVREGSADAAALMAQLRQDGFRKVLHLCGRDVTPTEFLPSQRVPVYASDAVTRLPPAVGQALTEGALVLLHSRRAAATFAALVPERAGVDLLAISAAAAAAAGDGWRSVFVADRPRDSAMLELAASLCQGAPASEQAGGE